MSVIYEFHHLFEEDNITTSEQNDRWESCEMHYVAYTSQPVEEEELWTAIRASENIPKVVMGCVMSNISNFEHCNLLCWKFSITYNWSRSASSSDGIDTDKETISYSFGSQTVTAKRCVEIMHTYGNCPNYGNLVDVQDGEAQGVEIYSPAASMKIQKYFRKTQFNATIRDKIIFRRCRVNDATFKGFLTGTVLFLGADIEEVPENDKYFSITFNFLLNENLENGSEGSITGINRKGHEQVWFHIRKENKSTRTIDGVYVGKFYHLADFTEMGLRAHV